MKVGSFYSKIESKIKDRYKFLNSKQTELSLSIENNSPDSEYILSLLDEAWSCLQAELDQLQSFAELNGTGVVKIVKKWDKQTRSATKKLYIERQAVIQPWFDRSSLTSLADRIANSIIQLNQIKNSLTKKLELEYNPEILQKNINNISPDTETSCSSPENVFFPPKILDLTLPQNIIGVLSKPTIDPSSLNLIKSNISSGKVDISWVGNISGRSIIHEFAKYGMHSILETAIIAGADINSTDSYGRYPLFYAIQGGFYNAVSVLLQHGANPNVSSLGTPSLSMAASLDYFDTFNLILSNPNFKWNQADLASALFKSCERDSWKIPNSLLLYGLDIISAVNTSGQTALHISCLNGNLNLTKWLLENGLSVSAVDKFSTWTSLFFAASYGFKEIVQLLIDHNSDPLAIDDQSHTPAFYAAYNGHIECAYLLSSLNSLPVQTTEVPEINNDDLIPSLELPPPLIPFNTNRRTDNTENSRVIIRFSSKNYEYAQPVKFINHTKLKSLRLQSSIKFLSSSISRTTNLPLQSSTSSISFEAPVDSDFSIEFLLFPSFGSVVIGRASIFSSAFNTESEVFYKVPLIGSDMSIVAELTFDFLFLKPFMPGPYAELPIPRPVWDNFMLCNDVEKHKKILEIKIQLTKDGIPIIYGNDTICVSRNVFIPIGFLSFSDLQQLGFTIIPEPSDRNWDSVCNESDASLSWRKQLIASCAPLMHLLLKLPIDIGLVITYNPCKQVQGMMRLNKQVNLILADFLKSLLKKHSDTDIGQSIEEFNIRKNSVSQLHATYNQGDNKFTISEKKVNRTMFFNSDSIAICHMFLWKQPIFPVFLTMNLSSPVKERAINWDISYLSLKHAIKAAFKEGFFGLVADYELFSKIDGLVNAVKEHELELILDFNRDVSGPIRDTIVCKQTEVSQFASFVDHLMLLTH
ncbi:Ankyrin repeat protein nuc-2 [Smittium culicis]|uniref:Ankyrin repeat protein nuc-2 n=1 Tax=Smittium culicis TaxID=133412 RepID=A0A1R1X0E3_9FUNG|nr:Ankyrin repeat protein nuc-2 [Smittium culicis]